ncbi:hypothetical protein [uncultured Ruegeria sp.]|nr:hypothetical protein [uncultured Ruegeria sp.]
MTNTMHKSYQSLSFLFMLNWDMLLSFAVTALALVCGAYLAGM